MDSHVTYIIDLLLPATRFMSRIVTYVYILVLYTRIKKLYLYIHLYIIYIRLHVLYRCTCHIQTAVCTHYKYTCIYCAFMYGVVLLLRLMVEHILYMHMMY